MSSGRVLALDVGSVRIGAAISDTSRIIAQPLDTWNAENDSWRNNFDECMRNYDPAIIVVGLPLRTDGKKSEAGERIIELVDELRAKYHEREFVLHDERFTTVIAQKVLIGADVSRKRRRKNVDKISAVLILESWLESNR